MAFWRIFPAHGAGQRARFDLRLSDLRAGRKIQPFGYGAKLPDQVRQELHKFDEQSRKQRTRRETLRLIAQGIIGVWLIAALAFHLAEVGLIGLSVIILATSLSGVTDEHAIGKAFTEALPFTALLAVFRRRGGDY